jgi:PAS domain-containing protein
MGLDLDGTITSWNRGAEKRYGYVAADAIGKTVAMLLDAEHESLLPGYLADIESGCSAASASSETSPAAARRHPSADAGDRELAVERRELLSQRVHRRREARRALGLRQHLRRQGRARGASRREG